MVHHITKHRSGFRTGLTEITRLGEEDDAGIAFSILKLAKEEVEVQAEMETAWLLMQGKLTLRLDGQEIQLERRSLFDELPSCFHVSQGASVAFETADAVELAVFRTANVADFPSRVYLPADVRNEKRGKGGLKDAAFRFVRTIFDDENSHENVELVLGEVINLPGRWSSYPPHHHVQPEIYHYRFTKPDGFGHSELGEEVFRIRHHDTVKILDAKDHAQCAAPGYGMYYFWVIRHLPGARYKAPEFTPAHRWTLEPDAAHWWPKSE